MATRSATQLVAATLLAACGLFGPDGGDRTLTIELPFCGVSATPVTWASVKRNDENWITLDVADGTTEFTARGKVTVALGGANETRIYSATADELSQVRCFPEWTATRVLQGSVRDVPDDHRFYVSVGPTTVETTPFAVFIPEGPLDLVARTEDRTTAEPQKVITRHDINLPSGSEIPVLLFANEAREFQSANATIVGASQAFFTNTFRSWGNSHPLWGGNVGVAPIKHFAVPAELLAERDYHVLEIRDVAANVLTELVYYYHRSRDTTLTIGPSASTPTGNVLASTPCSRFRASVPSQSAYPSFVTVRFFVGSQGNVEVGVTRGFLGATPATWVVDIPDIRQPDGSCLLPPNLGSWSMMVVPQEGRIATYLGGVGRDGEVRRWSSAFWNSQ